MAGVSADVEMVRPALGDDGVYGVEGAGVPKKWDWRFGLVTQYEHDPVLILTEGQISERPVTNRLGAWAGYSMGFGRRVAVQAVIPLDFQAGDGSSLSSPGGGIGDPRLGVRWGGYDSQILDATLRADLYLPAGRRDAWLGEATPRGAVGGSVALDGGFGALLVDAGVVIRPLETPQPRMDWGPTGELGIGARVDITDNFSAGGSWVARAVLAGLSTGDGELASEVLASARYGVTPDIALTAGGGFGTQAGVGVPTFRVFAGATFVGSLKKPEPKPVPVVENRPPPDPQKILVEEIPNIEVPPPPPEPPAKVVGDEIFFRGEIKFKEDSAEILPESKPVLEAIAALLANDGRIAHMAIEGHASEEGDLVYNWDLSDRRARSVWEALIREGIDPQRMSWRGLGEVIPADPKAADSEKARAADRRVVLRVARWLAKDEALPPTPATTFLPWSGETASLDPVVLPAPEAPPPKEIIDQSFFEEEEE